MAGKTIVILGGGFGGVTAALELRRTLASEHTVTLIERRPMFMMGLRKLWVLTGRSSRQQGQRSLSTLRAKGIDLRQATITAIETRARVVRTDEGPVRFDYLIVALGAEPRPDLVPGFSPVSFNLYDADDVERLAARVATFSGGRIVIAILGLPYKCPPAPYEAAMLLDDVFRQRGIRNAVEIQTFTPQPMSLPVVGAAGCAQVEGHLASKGIAFTPNRKALRLEGNTVIFDGITIIADLLIGVPPHRPPSVVRESGLPMSGEWITVDPTMLRTSVDGIFAVGDVVEIPLANSMTLPKAGIFAEGHAKVAAAAIIAEIIGRTAPPAYDGKGYCFIEVGGRRASMIKGDFFTRPAPTVEITPPSEETFQQKLQFERTRLVSWFESSIRYR